MSSLFQNVSSFCTTIASRSWQTYSSTRQSQEQIWYVGNSDIHSLHGFSTHVQCFFPRIQRVQIYPRAQICNQPRGCAEIADRDAPPLWIVQLDQKIDFWYIGISIFFWYLVFAVWLKEIFFFLRIAGKAAWGRSKQFCNEVAQNSFGKIQDYNNELCERSRSKKPVSCPRGINQRSTTRWIQEKS